MKRLIVVTKKWGRNFTGATLATQHFVERWIDYFDCVSVYTLQCGEAIQNRVLTVRTFNNEHMLIRHLSEDAPRIKSSTKFVCYSDDHLGFAFSIAGLSYVHTYHGNWPEAKYISVDLFLKSFYFIPLYAWTIKKAKVVVNVSEYMERFTSKYNHNAVVIHNGIESKNPSDEIIENNCFLMVGNIDQRKYGYAIDVFEKLRQMGSKVYIDIFGKTLDQRIEEKLRTLPYVRLYGSVKNIPYKKYNGLINTSKMENLSISVCEAIKSKIPVFCFEVGGLPEVVQNGKTGFVFSKFDTYAMAKQIYDYSLSERHMKVDASVLDDFDWKIAAKKYLDLFLM